MGSSTSPQIDQSLQQLISITSQNIYIEIAGHQPSSQILGIYGYLHVIT